MPNKFIVNGVAVDTLPESEGQKIALDPETKAALLGYIEKNQDNPQYQAFIAGEDVRRLDSMMGEPGNEESKEEQKAVDASLDFLTGLVGENDTKYVESVAVMVNGQLVRFGIRHLSPKAVNALKRKRLRLGVGGRLMPVADADSVLRAHTLTECVCKTDPATTAWVPLWTSVDDVLGTDKKAGFLDNASEAAEELRAQLFDEIYRIHPMLRPDFLEAQDIVMQETAKVIASNS